VSTSKKLAAAAIAAALLASAGPATAATTVLVSSVNGVVGDQESYQTDVSDDGSIAVFSSLAANWGFPYVQAGWHTFVLDRTTGAMSVLDGTADGFGASVSTDPVLSGDGRYVAFVTPDPFVAADTNYSADVYVYDRATGDYDVVSVSSDGAVGQTTWQDPNCPCEPSNLSAEPSISTDGRWVAFSSWATNLFPGDVPSTHDVFVHDRATRQTYRVAAGSEPSISGDGRFVAFSSDAALVAADTNGTSDVYVADLAAGTFELVSVSSAGAAGNSYSVKAAISADGARVAFVSNASNLVRRDTNGAADVFCRDRAAGSTVNLSASAAPWADYPSISADGLQAAFTTNQAAYVTSTSSPRPLVVSVHTSGYKGLGQYFNTAVNGDGKVVAFDGYGILSPADTNDAKDVFLRDLSRK
jgi:Tol biopolymer transport system component